MGIHGLWQVLEPTGRPVNIHSLRGKVLAVDVSIWLHQLVKGFRDKDGNPLPNAHLLGIFHRVCKLLNDGIKPVFVFDGGVPVLKRQTLAARRQRKLESLDKAEISRQKILSAYLRQQLQRHAKITLPPSLRMQAQIDALSGASKKSPSVSPKKRKIDTLSQASDKTTDEHKVDEDLAEFRAALIAKLEDDVDEVNPHVRNSLSDSEDEEPEKEYQYGVDYSENFSIIQAPSFDTLPLETQHEILFEMQESRKMNSWGKFDKMPKDLQSFSSYQMDRLVKRRTLQKKIQSVQQEMGQRHIHVQNLDDLLKMEYNTFDDKNTEIKGSQGDGFVLIKTQPPSKGKDKEDPKPGTSAGASKGTPQIITIDDFIEDSFSDNENEIVCVGDEVKVGESKKGREQTHAVKGIPSDEEDADIKLAIELSLRDSGQNETSKKDDHADANGASSSNSLTKGPTTPTPAQYCHAEKNAETIEFKSSFTEDDPNVKEKSQEKCSITTQFSQMSHCAKFLDTVGFHLPQANSSSIEREQIKPLSTTNPDTFVSSSKEQCKNSQTIIEKSSDSETDNDDDFEEVQDTPTFTEPAVAVATIDLAAIQKLAPGEEDMFADVFAESSESLEIVNSKTEEKNFSIPATQVPSTLEPVSLSPSKVTVEDNWDSDSEIEADLVEMVMKESVASENLKNGASSLTGKRNATNVYNTESNAQSKSSSETSDSKNPPPVKMITADYMQAQQQLNSQLGKLHSEMGQQERIATSISDQMQLETQELISLFGIPYIISPTEAESQCAFLDKACLTEGTITDDSDVWLFGGQRVYKNFFSQGQRHVELYQAADIQRVLNLNREKLIVLAIMIGSDYSDGIQGVGPVLALEILSEFASMDVESFEILLKFREWWDEIQAKPLDLFAGSKLREKLRKLKLRPGFPSKAVFDAFINPTIDTSTEAFKWGNPDLDAIRNYTKQKFGWEQSKCDSLLLPVLKKRQCELDQSRQLTLDSYISFGKMPSLGGGKRKKGSKRIQTAVKRLKRVGVDSHELNLSSESDSDVEAEKVSKKTTASQKQPKATNRVVKRKESSSLSGESLDTKKKHQQEATVSQSNAAASTSSSSSTSSTTANINRLPTPKKTEVIPQRVQSETDKMKNKQKAIEIFKKRKTKP